MNSCHAQGKQIRWLEKYSELQEESGEIVPVIITAYEDKSHDFVIKTSPVAGLILKAAGVKKGSANPKVIVGHISKAQLKEIAEYKLPDLNCDNIEAAMKVVAGSCLNGSCSLISLYKNPSKKRSLRDFVVEKLCVSCGGICVGLSDFIYSSAVFINMFSSFF